MTFEPDAYVWASALSGKGISINPAAMRIACQIVWWPQGNLERSCKIRISETTGNLRETFVQKFDVERKN